MYIVTPAAMIADPPTKTSECSLQNAAWMRELCRLRVLEALDPVDGPEIHGKSWVADVLVGHVEVSLVTPPEQKRSRRGQGTSRYKP